MMDNPETTRKELWSLLMRLADPSDLLRTFLNENGGSAPPEAAAFYQQALVFTGCTVHIHQHGAPPIEPTAAPPPAVP